ncbi:hypothetical protein E8E14_013922 [Neopestalotiopsis sp. 37M]|nr:hypothetical protein E8E14_013922 [Neopestalotiopsis sp. 37M]
MDTLLEQLKTLAVQADSDGRHKVLDFIRTLQLSLETPHDMLSRFSGLVSQHLSIAAARIGEDLNLFQILAESEQPLSAEELATKTGAATLLARYPELQGKLVLEDLQQALEHLPPPLATQLKGVEQVAHNFFEPQPIKGARFYYLRQVLHDWPDENCVVILKHLMDALGPDSQILIDEMVLPDANVPWEATTIDLTMMASLGARERTNKEWHALLDKAGLKVLRIDTYLPRRQDSIIQAVPK